MPAKKLSVNVNSQVSQTLQAKKATGPVRWFPSESLCIHAPTLFCLSLNFLTWPSPSHKDQVLVSACHCHHYPFLRLVIPEAQAHHP